MSIAERKSRRQDFLDIALELFYQKGFENTTINDIIEEAGVSKGAFYHYFNSKEEVLETIARQYVEKKLNVIEKIAGQDDLNSLEKINQISEDMFGFKMRHAEMRWKIYKIIARNNNIKLENQILEYSLELSRPIYHKIIMQGITEGTFHINYPEEATELYIYLNSIFNKMSSKIIIDLFESDLDDLETLKRKMMEPKCIEILTRRFAFYEETLERILGIERGSIKLVEPLLEKLKHL
jgi:AcrR family transcriptional regulator